MHSQTRPLQLVAICNFCKATTQRVGLAQSSLFLGRWTRCVIRILVTIDKGAWKPHSTIHLSEITVSRPLVSMPSPLMCILYLVNIQEPAAERLKHWQESCKLKRHLHNRRNQKDGANCPLCGPSGNIHAHLKSYHRMQVI